MNRPRFLIAAMAVIHFIGTAAAQGVTTLVVPYPAGGPSDFVARTVQPELQRALGRSVVVDNVGGASGGLGIQTVVGGPADGSALVLATPMELVLAPLALQAVRHKPEDLRPVGVTAPQPYALLPSLPALAASKGFERLVFDIWAGLFVSAKVPDAAVATLHAAVKQAVQNPGMRKAFESTGNVVAPLRSVAGLHAFYADEIARYQAIAKDAHVQPE